MLIFMLAMMEILLLRMKLNGPLRSVIAGFNCITFPIRASIRTYFRLSLHDDIIFDTDVFSIVFGSMFNCLFLFVSG